MAALGVAQAALAGSFLNGHYGALNAHLVTAMAMVALAVVQAAVAVFLRRAGGPRPATRLALFLPLALAAQAALGMGRVLGLHVPLGVFIVAGTLRLTAWVWRTPLPAQAPVARSRPAGVPS